MSEAMSIPYGDISSAIISDYKAVYVYASYVQYGFVDGNQNVRATDFLIPTSFDMIILYDIQSPAYTGGFSNSSLIRPMVMTKSNARLSPVLTGIMGDGTSSWVFYRESSIGLILKNDRLSGDGNSAGPWPNYISFIAYAKR